MLVVPIINRDRIMNVEIKLKNATKLDRKNITLKEGVSKSNIISHNSDYNTSSYNINDDASLITEYIRNSGILYKKNYVIVTKEEAESTEFDSFEVKYPRLRVNENIDKLYGELVKDLKNSMPDNIKGHYIDFSKLGITKNITKEKLKTLKDIADHSDPKDYKREIEENDLDDLIIELEFLLNEFDLTIIPESTMKLEYFDKLLDIFSNIKSRDYKALKNYKQIADNNKECYSKISKLYNIVYNDSLNWIHKETPKEKAKVNMKKAS